MAGNVRRESANKRFVALNIVKKIARNICIDWRKFKKFGCKCGLCAGPWKESHFNDSLFDNRQNCD